MTREIRTDNRSWGLQYIALAFIDALGTKAAMRGLEDIPDRPEDQQQFRERLVDVLGRLRFTRESYRDYLNAAASSEPLPHVGKPPLRILERSFSDAITLSVEISGDDSFVLQTDAILRLLFGVSMMQLIGLSVGIPQRGGIDSAVGTEIEPGTGEVYGPVLVRAHDLEHNHAEYPRVLIGEGLREFLVHVAEKEIDNSLKRVAQGFAKKAIGMIVLDSDGRWMLDFMGPGVREIADDFPAERVTAALQFVDQQAQAFRDQRNDKLESRYYRLWRYMNERKRFWLPVVPESTSSK